MRPNSAIAFVVAVVFVASCSETGVIGESHPPDPSPRRESCGNGLDDDRDGRIDDGCPCGPGEVQSCFSGDYPSNGIGTCRPGMIECAVSTHLEWGDWGDYVCTGETLPNDAEVCDGDDDDCDGAVDEGCSCEVGISRVCGEDFRVAPCMPGRQMCERGVWSVCEGAVGPSAERCGDGIDNDCNGEIDDASLCRCIPIPEVCANDIDDDCDGDIDEPACQPVFDEECQPSTGPQCFARVGSLMELGTFPSGFQPSLNAASSGAEMVVVGTGFFTRVNATGLIEQRPFFLREPSQLVDTGEEYVLAWLSSGTMHIQRVSRTGELLGAPVLIEAVAQGRGRIAWADGVLLVMFGVQQTPDVPGAVDLYVQRFDASLTALGPPARLDIEANFPGSILQPPRSITALDRTRFVSSHIRLVTVGSGDQITAVFEPSVRDGESLSHDHVSLSSSCDRVLAWWHSSTSSYEPGRWADAPRMAVLDDTGRAVAPVVEPIGERFGMPADTTLVPLGAKGFFVLSFTHDFLWLEDGTAMDSDSWSTAMIVRVALDGTVLQRIELTNHDKGNYSATAARVGDCVLMVSIRTNYPTSSDSTLLLSTYCPAPC